MNEAIYITKGSRRDSRPRSLCARCGNIKEVETRTASPGRGSWRDAGRSLSLEINGREGRKRNSSTDPSNGRQRSSPLHCYIVSTNGQNAAQSTTTYRESFRNPPSQPTGFKHSRSVPSSPVPASPLWSPMSASPRGTPSYRQDNTPALLSQVPSRLQSVQPAGKKTTYRDHFNWFS